MSKRIYSTFPEWLNESDKYLELVAVAPAAALALHRLYCICTRRGRLRGGVYKLANQVGMPATSVGPSLSLLLERGFVVRYEHSGDIFWELVDYERGLTARMKTDKNRGRAIYPGPNDPNGHTHGGRDDDRADHPAPHPADEGQEHQAGGSVGHAHGYPPGNEGGKPPANLNKVVDAQDAQDAQEILACKAREREQDLSSRACGRAHEGSPPASPESGDVGFADSADALEDKGTKAGHPKPPGSHKPRGKPGPRVITASVELDAEERQRRKAEAIAKFQAAFGEEAPP